MKETLKASVTPLASIFGSGFLVVAAILEDAVGASYAWVAMAGVVGFAYAVGSVIRSNMAQQPPCVVPEKVQADSSLNTHPLKTHQALVWVSDTALIVAYSVSVCLYLHILMDFFLAGIGLEGVLDSRVMVAFVIVIIALIGFRWGLKALQGIEIYALAVTLLLIGGLLGAFLVVHKGFFHDVPHDRSLWDTVRLVAGMLIVVQGFEISAYMGEKYSLRTRVHASRAAQIFSGIVYVAFVIAITPFIPLARAHGADALFFLVSQVLPWFSIPLVLVAILSQLSAAIADVIGGGGLLVQVTHKHMDSRHAYLVLCGLAVTLSFFGTLALLALASKTFALYYALQCFSYLKRQKECAAKVFGSILLALLLFVVIFALPVG